MRTRQQTWHKVEELLRKEFGVDDDTYKDVSKDIHNLFLADGWTPPEESPYTEAMMEAAVKAVESMGTGDLSEENKALIAAGVLEMIEKCLDGIEEQNKPKKEFPYNRAIRNTIRPGMFIIESTKPFADDDFVMIELYVLSQNMYEGSYNGIDRRIEGYGSTST